MRSCINKQQQNPNVQGFQVVWKEVCSNLPWNVVSIWRLQGRQARAGKPAADSACHPRSLGSLETLGGPQPPAGQEETLPDPYSWLLEKGEDRHEMSTWGGGTESVCWVNPGSKRS